MYVWGPGPSSLLLLVDIIMNVDQDLFSAYAFYAGVVTLKMLVMSPITIRTRLANGVFMSSEDNQGRWKEYKVHKTFGLNFKDFLTKLCAVRLVKV